MKKLIFIFIALFITTFTFTVNGQDFDSDVQETIEVVEETVDNSFEQAGEIIKSAVERNFEGKGKVDIAGRALLIPIVAIVFGTLFPVLIIFIVFYSGYKEKKAKYVVAEKALAAGKDIPEGLFGGSSYKENTNLLAKGIKNMCLGIALAIFLWAIIDEFWAACIGFIIFFNGLGQFLIYKMKPVDALQGTRKDRCKDDEEDIKDIPYFDIDTDNNANEKR